MVISDDSDRIVEKILLTAITIRSHEMRPRQPSKKCIVRFKARLNDVACGAIVNIIVLLLHLIIKLHYQARISLPLTANIC